MKILAFLRVFGPRPSVAACEHPSLSVAPARTSVLPTVRP